MERLTVKRLARLCNDDMFVQLDSKMKRQEFDMLAYSAPKYPEIYKKLADYEDAEEQGLLLRLPCKVGDTVYYINFYQGKIEEDTVMEFSLETYDWYVRLRQNKWVILGMFKKDFFLTREEAESALAEKGGAE